MLKSNFSSFTLEAGCDEAGRGCLAGPVFAAAVIFPAGFTHQLILDSKKLRQAQREEARLIIEQNALTWAVASVDNIVIDKLNILWAAVLAMHMALAKLSPVPEFILVDGNRFKPYQHIPYQCIIKGDDLYISIAAASILAKTARDEYMLKVHRDYPGYGWDSNKGYPTPAHIKAVHQLGLSPLHRRSFQTPVQLKIPYRE